MTTKATVQDLAPITPNTQLSIVRPVATAAALISLHEEVTTLIRDALKEGTDYGLMPGTKEKVLFKPGAERIAIAFGCSPRYEIVEHEIDHDREVVWKKVKKVWRNQFKGDRDHTENVVEGTSLGLYRYVIRCTLEQAVSNRVLAEGLASCSTMESKYIDRPRECENTVLKMAEKRGFVAAVLNAFGLSDRFTQDLEEEDAKDHRRDDRQEDGPQAPPSLQDKMRFIHASLADVNVKDDARHGWFGWLLGREIKSAKDMTDAELDRVTAHLKRLGGLSEQLEARGITDSKKKREWLADRLGRTAKPSELTEDEAQKLAAAAAEKAAT